MSLMKYSKGKRFSGELRIFISHTRNLTCRLVGSGNLSHEIVLLRVALSPAAFGNYLAHRLPLDRLPSIEMHLLFTKSALFPLPTSLRSWCGSPAATKGSPASSQEPRSSLPGARSLGKCNYISDTYWLRHRGAHRSKTALARLILPALPWVSRANCSPKTRQAPGLVSSTWCLCLLPCTGRVGRSRPAWAHRGGADLGLF